MLKKLNIAFYGDVFIKAFMACLVVYSFMFFQFWWGNHDWGYIKGGVGAFDGVFEARYSQHWLSALFFDGHIVHILAFLFSFACLVLCAILMAKYLELKENKIYYLAFVLFFALNPHNFAFFYYVYLSFPFFGWASIGVCCLYLSEPLANINAKIRLLVGGILFGIILGSYPANLALFLVLFVAKRILRFIENKENVRQFFKISLFFAFQLLIGFLIFKLVYIYIEKESLLNKHMYNLSIYGAKDIVKNIPKEMISALKVFFEERSFMGSGYIAILGVVVVLGVGCLFKECKDKKFAILMFLAMLLSSRFVFCICDTDEPVFFRVEYWGKSGILAFLLALIMRNNSKLVKNFVYLWGVFVVVVFALTDFYIQKVQYLGFASGRKYQYRLVERFLNNKEFDFNSEYISFTFGYPNFKLRYIDDKFLTAELTGNGMVFHFDVVDILFWEESLSPVAAGIGMLKAGNVLIVNRGNDEFWVTGKWMNNDENIKNIRMWLYDINRKQDDIYVDDKYIINILDINDFYKTRENLMVGIDSFK